MVLHTVIRAAALLGILVLMMIATACSSSDLDCATAVRLFREKNPWFVARDGGWGRGYNADATFATTDIQCEGVSREGQQAIAVLKVTANGGPVEGSSRSYVDPFRSQWIPASVPFEIDVAAKYRLYDSGWRHEAFSIKGGHAKQ